MKTWFLLCLLMMVGSAFGKPKAFIRQPIEHCRLFIKVNPTDHTLSGKVSLTLPNKGPKVAGFLLNKDFVVSSAKLGDQDVELIKSHLEEPRQVSPDYGVFGDWKADDAILWTTERDKKKRSRELNRAFSEEPLILEVEFHGSLYKEPENREFSREKIAFEINGTIGEEGVYLSPAAYWYPMLPDQIVIHEVTVRLPEGWNCVTDGNVHPIRYDDGWVEITYTSEQPTGALTLAAGRYMVQEVEHNGVQVATYFLPEQAELAGGYIDACCRYIDMYSSLIGPYPFPGFVVVDNFLPSGYGMPGWTLLGSEVLRLPFIKDISLGHEILHNWLGNSLLVDYREGNWCEGLTTYLADYKYKEEADSSAAREYRMNILRDYVAYVNPENDYPVTNFSSRSDQTDRAIGYGKVMMIFHMLRKLLDQYDETVFVQVIQETYTKYRWQPIGWSIWQREFERRLGQKLNWFFEQWLHQTGMPEIALNNVKVEHVDGRWEAKFEVVTKAPIERDLKYRLLVRTLSSTGTTDYIAFIQNNEQGITLSGSGELMSIRLDPNFNLFRRIYPGEMPLTLAQFFGDSEGVMVIPSQGMKVDDYRRVAEGLKTEKQQVIMDQDFTEEKAKGPVWLFGDPDINSAWKYFPMDPSRLEYLPFRAPRWREEQSMSQGMNFVGEEFRGGKLVATLIDMHPSKPEKCVVYTLALTDADVLEGTRKLTHYGKYSYVLFDGDQNLRKGNWVVSGESPMAWRNTETGR